MRITKKIISLLLVVSMIASFFAMSGFEASAALTGQQKTDFGLHFDDTTRKFKVLQLSDIQTDHGDSNIALTTKETIRMAIEQYDPDLILLSGDQVQGGSGLLATLSEWKSSINAVFNTFTPYMRSDCKVIAVPGNHEYDYGNLKDQWEYYNSQSWYLDWDNNFSTVDLNGEPGAGNVTVSADSGNKAVALNIALFNSKGDDEDGYLRPGGDDDAAYQQIVDWYTATNNTLASSAYSYKAQVTGQSSAYVPAFGMQHVILQEIYNSMVACGSTEGVPAATDGNYSSLLNASYMKFKDGLTYTGVLGEAPCPSTLGAGATTALYNALLSPGNFLGMCFGHDHLNTFDITDANGFRFLMGGALTTENYNNGNPNVRYMEFTLDDATGEVDLKSETKSFNEYTTSAVTDVTSDRIEAINGNGVQFINTISVPKTIYIGSTENNTDPRAIQKKGTYVQPLLLDYQTKNYYEQDLNVSFCVPANAQISSYGAWAGNGSGTQLTLDLITTETTAEGVRYDFKIATSN
ncbi:MAG: metallophosphoesterase, partial [Clostridia bacterium]|nr:metallophosphoesterase [Clostridia bacterium]